jgi:hypothetical protein
VPKVAAAAALLGGCGLPMMLEGLVLGRHEVFLSVDVLAYKLYGQLQVGEEVGSFHGLRKLDSTVCMIQMITEGMMLHAE